MCFPAPISSMCAPRIAHCEQARRLEQVCHADGGRAAAKVQVISRSCFREITNCAMLPVAIRVTMARALNMQEGVLHLNAMPLEIAMGIQAHQAMIVCVEDGWATFMRMLLHGRAFGKAVSMTMSMTMARSIIVGVTKTGVGLVMVTVVASLLATLGLLAFILEVTTTLGMVTMAVTVVLAIIMVIGRIAGTMAIVMAILVDIIRCRRCGRRVRSIVLARFLSGVPTAVHIALLPGSGST